MKLLIASDIHGDILSTRRVIQTAKEQKVDKILLLGDVLYHGPRNDLPEHYSPKEVIALLNENAQNILCIKGNCEAEVDGMVLNFPVLCEQGFVYDGDCGVSMYLSHGHKYNPENLPPLPENSVFLYGHTHIYKCEKVNNIFCINPGSVTLPKGGNPKTLALYESGVFKIIGENGEIAESIKVC